MALYQAGYQLSSGRVEIGIVGVSKYPGCMEVWLKNTEGSRRLRFSEIDWLDEAQVNDELREAGVLWRRTKTEGEYRREAKR